MKSSSVSRDQVVEGTEERRGESSLLPPFRKRRQGRIVSQRLAYGGKDLRCERRVFRGKKVNALGRNSVSVRERHDALLLLVAELGRAMLTQLMFVAEVHLPLAHLLAHCHLLPPC